MLSNTTLADSISASVYGRWLDNSSYTRGRSLYRLLGLRP